jgi:uncharacterized protein (TIGR00288 family)
MANPPDTPSMALFCDFENVALGVRDAKYEKFDIRKVLERLLLKGSIVVKKAYCDWERYREFKAPMHEASFELIEIPHVRQSGKNSADIRMVVDALDLCYTKSHVDTFVIISGDSDFSPLVSKLRENNKTVIGVGVKGSTSDLLTANCDEFIFYDDLVREQRRRGAQNAARREGGREPQRDAGRDAGRDGRGNGRGIGRGPEREGAREPLRSVQGGLALQPPGIAVPPAGLALPPGVAGQPAAGADDTHSVGGPWRRYAVEPREPSQADAGAELVDEAARAAAESEGFDTGAVGEHAADVDGNVAEEAPAAAPARRPRRARPRAADALIGLDGDTAVTAADLAAADAAGATADAAPLDAAPADEAPAADAPKKRAPRRRKVAPGDAAQAELPETPEAPPMAAAPEPEPEPADPEPAWLELADTPPPGRQAADGAPRAPRSDDEKRQEAVDLALETVEALITERGADDKIWGSMVKQTLKRRRPGFAESYYGYRSFNELLEDARDRGLLALDHDEKSGGYVIRLL